MFCKSLTPPDPNPPHALDNDPLCINAQLFACELPVFPIIFKWLVPFSSELFSWQKSNDDTGFSEYGWLLDYMHIPQWLRYVH